MRTLLAILTVFLVATMATAQPYTETFEGISAVGAVKPTSFTTGGQSFTTTSAVCSTGNNFGVWIPNHAWTNCNGVTATNLNVFNYGVGTSCTSGSCSGTSSKFIDASAVGSNVSQVYSIKTSDAALFTMRSMHVFLSTDNSANPGGSSVTFRGKRGGVTKFTVTKSSGLVTTYSTNNGFNYINFVTEGGTNNTLTNIDEIEMQGGGAVNYVAVDNFVFSVRNGPLVTTSAATAVTGSTVTLNGIVNDNGLSTTSIIFEYSTSPTLASGVSTVTATPSSLGANAGNTSASANVTGLIGSTTYYFRVKATNAGGTNTGSILNFATSAASSPSVTVTATTNVSCNGGSNGSATVNATGGTTPYTYAWSGGGSGATKTGLSAGTYTCTVTDGASMTATVTATITQPAALTVTGTNTLCATTTLSASMSGGTWSSSNTAVATVGSTGIVSGVAAGTAEITYVHTCGSPTRGVTVNLANPGTITGQTTLCATTFIAHGTTGTAGGTWVSSNTAVGTINPSTGTMGGVVSSSPASTTTVSYTVTNSCGSMTSTVVNTVYRLSDTGTVTGPTSVCVGSSSTAFSSTSVTSTSGVGNFNYTWTSSNASVSTINSSGIATGLAVGTARISYTASGCGNFRVFRTLNVLPASVPATTGTNTVTAGSTTTLSNTVSGGTWSSTNTAVGTVSTGGVVTGISGGTTIISYLVTNSCGTFVSTTNVTVFGTVTASITAQTNITCNGGSDGSLTAAGSGGTPGYTYMWSNGATSAAITGLVPGTFTCTVADAATGSATVSATITEPAVLTVTGTNTLCATTTLTASQSGGTWSSSNTAVATVGSTGIVSGVAAGTAIITYVHTCGSPTRGVTVNLANPGMITGLTTMCATTFIAHGTTGTAGGTWVSSNTAVGTINSSTGTMGGVLSSSPASTTTVSYTVTNSCGSMTATVNNTVYTLSDTGVVSGPTSVCAGSTSTAFSSTSTTSTSGVGPFSYTWTSSNGAVCTINSSSGVATGLTVGTTRISYTATGCGNFRAFRTLNVLPASVPATTGTNTVTAGSTTTLSNTVSGGTWSSTNAAVGTVSTGGVVTGISAGTTIISYLVSNSCGTFVSTTNVTVLSSFSASLTAQTNVSCSGGTNGSATVTPSGGTSPFSYSWAPSGGTAATATGLAAGTYTCTVSDAASGTATVTATITAPSAIVVTAASQTNISCNGFSNGAASINTPTGGAGGYTYDWTPGTPTGDGTTSVSGLSAGTYTCTVTDANGCTAGRSFTITGPSTLVVSSSSQTNLTCFGGNNGAASVSVSGGTTSYAYNWTPGNPTGDGTSSVTGLTAGSWTCTVTDANSCTTTQTFNITSPSALVVTPLSQTNVSCNGGSNGAASISVSGGVTAYTYNWTPGTPTGDGTTSVTGLTAGSWTCTVTDANSCSAQQTFNITQPPVLAVTAASQTNVACFGGSNGAATVNTPTGGAGSYTYNWTPGTPTGDGTVSVSGLTAGSWTCTVTDANTCTTTQTFTITAPSSLVVTPASQTNVSCFGANNGAASINTATGGAGGYTYDWTPGTPTGDGTISVSGLTAGTWTCTVTDANACTAMQQFTITAPTPFVVTPASQTNVLCNGGSNGAASINTPTGGAGGYTYNWTPGNPTGDGTVSVTGLTAGSWTCTVTDANSCISSHTFTITEPPAVSGTITGSDNVCQSATTTLTISGMSGGVWSSTNTAAGSVNPTTGVVTGVSGGTTTISYTVTDVCGTAAATKVITVTSLPGTISGTLAICEGTTTTLGNTASGGTWSSSNSGVASIDGTTGAVSGAGAGTAMISYSTGCGTPSTATMTINPIPAAISGTATICIGGTTTLSNSVSGGTWSSGTPAVATVHPTTGVVTGVSAGNSDISYIMGCASVKRIVTVNGGPAVAAVTGSSSVCEGATISLSDATADGTWSSSNTAIATVGTSGTVTGVSGGTAAISYIVTATCGSSYAVKIVTVHSLPAPISGTASVCEGNTTALSTTPGGGTWSSSTVAASVHPSTGLVTGDNEGSTIISYQSPAGCYRTIEVTVNATPGIIVGSAVTCVGTTTTLSAPPGGGTWSSSFPGKATVDVNSGVVTGVSAGTTIISYNLPFGCRSTAVVTVITTPATITGSLSLCGGSTSALSSATTGGTWSSSDAGVATINASTGVVTGISTGTTTISYATGSCATTAVVTVGGTMTGSTGTALVCAGQAATLSNATSGGTWSSSNTSAATVHAATGLVTGVGAGTTNITYTLSGGCYSVTEVTVNAAMASITGSGTVCAGSTTPLSHADGGGVWSSSNTSRVTIDAGSGIMTGVAGGSATISYVLSAGCVTTRVITVNVLPNTIGSGSSSVCLGGGTSYTCTPSGGTWSSTTTGVATIGSTGVISSVSEGTSVISYTISTGCASTRTVTVLASPSAITGSATACIGSTTTLSSSPAGGTWTSSVPSKATVVAATGVVTGVAAGNSTITYTLSTGCRRTIIATVVTLPGAIGGVLTLCSSCTTTLTSATFSGTWTSSNAGVATVNPTTGVVSGVGVGTSMISYTVGTGCSRTAVVTVGATPAPITGTHIVCVGQTNATLDHPVPVGTWSSSNTTVATVHAATGIFTGIGSGTATISYIISPGYYATTAVTVEPAVATISGNSGICPGATMMLSNTTPSGVWSSNSPLKATVDPGTGLVTAITTGTAAITYTVGIGCYNVAIVTVNTVPNIMGSNTVANGGTTTLIGSPAGGVWASADAGVASVVAGTGVVTGVSLGATSMSYTIGAGCSGVRTITVVVPRPGMSGVAAEGPGVLKVYPNPTSGILTVEAPVAGRFNVYTIDGREVAQYVVTASANMVTLPSNLTAGIYMCRFVGADGTSAIVRLVYEQ